MRVGVGESFIEMMRTGRKCGVYVLLDTQGSS